MLKKFVLFIVLIMLTSCASIIGRKQQTMFVYSDMPNTQIVINDTINYKILGNYYSSVRTTVTLNRSEKPLKIKVLQNDTLVNDTLLKPKLNSVYIWGNMYPLMWAGYLIDFSTEKRFTYGKYLFIDTAGNIKRYKHLAKSSKKYAELNFHKYKKGSYNILLAIPEINIFHLSPQGETEKNTAGFMGIGLGAEYFYKNNKSLQLRADAIMNSIIFVPAPVDWDRYSPHESYYAINLNLTDNFNINRFQLGYGINFARNEWVLSGYTDKETEKFINGKRKINQMLGLAFNASFRVCNRFYIGLIYRPSFLTLAAKPKFTYEHTISFDFMFKFGK